MKTDAQITNVIEIDTQAESNRNNEDEVLRRIASAISGVRFGSVEVVIQDSRVVQIERKEKFRFDKPSRA
ncbi:MAG TPA: YezD family protein [Methylomirabilota bacterium]|nr:YezD family protein [Methylomirabilota bacterium]